MVFTDILRVITMIITIISGSKSAKILRSLNFTSVLLYISTKTPPGRGEDKISINMEETRNELLNISDGSHKYMKISAKSILLENSICCVCGDKGFTKSYGNILCRGCTDFFKRCLDKNLQLTCKHKRECEITKENRAKCRYCRLKKCFDCGIKRELWEINKKRYSKNFKNNYLNKENSQNKLPIKISEIKTPPVSFTNTTGMRIKTDCSEKDKSSYLKSSSTQIMSQPKENILDNLIECENIMKHPKRWHCYNSKVFFETMKENGEIVYSGGVLKPLNEMLRFTIQWTEAVGNFINLQKSDKILLIEEFACKSIILCLMYRAMDNENFIYMTEKSIDEKYDESDDKRIFNKFFGKKLRELVNKMIKLNVTYVEFIFIKATLFLNNNADGLSNDGSSSILELKKTILQTFIKYKNNDSLSCLLRLYDLLCSISSLLDILSKMIMKNKILRDIFNMDNAGSLIQQYIGGPNVTSEDEINEGIMSEDDFYR
uniref:Nuclear receptor subfamily 2 group F member 6 (inferred by orthology to a human protein) n=1 Tax=Strongyloides venezuelensis TaxID=75913 RepID=A0A0K0F887_STRVS